jgi:hypothetical protein
MPLHDWTRVESGIFHAFHTTWIAEIQTELNGQLPAQYYALAEQHAGGFVADVLTLQVPPNEHVDNTDSVNGNDDDVGKQAEKAGLESVGTAVTHRAPAVAVQEKIESEIKDLHRTVTIRHVSNHRIVALLEIVSPANKDRQQHINEFVHKNVDAIQRGIHVLIVDLFAAGSQDPFGIHPLIRARLQPARLQPASDSEDDVISPRATLAAYAAGDPVNAYLEFPAEDEPLAEMPIFLTTDRYINVALEATYQRAWNGMPKFWQGVIVDK